MLLPKFVKNRVKRGARYIAEAKTEVSVIFCDICEFEKICRDYSPQELVIFLDKLFSRFDVLCENHGVIKIETVGKTYMACAGLIDYDQDLATYLRKVPHAKRAVEFSFALIEEVKDIMLKNGESLKVKIGINSGPVTAGVVGYHKPQFSLVGDTINTASRMCSTLKAFNSIQISSETFNMLQESEDYNFEKITVEAKGKGFLDTFLIDLVRRKSISEELSKGLASRTEIISPLQIFSNNLSQDLNFSSKKKSWRKIIQKAGDSPYLEEYPSFLTGNRKTTLIENRFEKDLQFKSFESTIICLVTAFFTYFLMFFFSFLDYFVTKNSLSPVPIILRGCAMIYLGLICFFFRVLNRLKYKDFVIKPCMVLMYFCSISNLFYSEKVNPDLMCNEILLSFLLLCQSTQSSLIFQLLFSSLQLIIWLLLASLQSSILDHILYFFLVMIVSIIHIRSLYSKDRIERRNFNLKSIARREIFENTTLLKKLMPKHVLKHLKKELHFTDRLENVTLLYADIVGFTSWSSNKCPNEIVEMLSELFTSFDRLCVELDVYKVCTIGDCYVVMGLSSNGIRNEVLECVNVVKMAFKMIEVINEKNEQHSSKLNMRIGLHTGEVIGGVIGTSIVRYDIWGPDVLIANKMESNGEPGRVKISEDTKEVLDSNLVEGLKFELSDPVDIKSLGLSKQSFFVTCLNDEDLFVNLVK
jgi:phospholipid-translocating ATPase